MPAVLPRILVGATFTTTPLLEPLQFWLDQVRATYAVSVATYGQLFQTLLDKTGIFAANEAGVNVVLIRLEDLAGADGSELISHAFELADVLIGAAATSRVPYLCCLGPLSEATWQDDEQRNVYLALRDRIEEKWTGLPNLHCLSSKQILERYQVQEVVDPMADRAGHIPYTLEFFSALAAEIVRKTTALERTPHKVISVDCDNTLWSGVCGEDGPEGVRIEAGRIALQEFLCREKSRGALLVLTSKNNEEDVRDTFASHPEMPLLWDDFVAHRINWSAKSANLLALAEELNLGIDSFVHIDDDPRECAEVREDVPGVICIELPPETGTIPQFLNHLWIFDRLRAVTKEDERRSRLYQEEAQRRQVQQQSGNLRSFLSHLRLEVQFEPLQEETFSRAAQLIQRTNQMNTSLVRRTEAELRQETVSGQLQGFTIRVVDRFGNYGLVGLVLYRRENDHLVIDTFLLSCRALGRGVEHRMLAHTAQVATALGLKTIAVREVDGPRNQPARQFLEAMRQRAGITSTDNSFDADTLTDIDVFEISDTQSAANELAGSAPETNSSAAADTVDWSGLARELGTAQKILAAIGKKKKQATKLPRAISTPPATELERQLAAIWCDLLGLQSVGVEEDFFDLGGHSLLAVQLLSRVSRDLSVDLPDAVIYGEKLRIRNLARTIELLQLGIQDGEGYEEAFAEINALSDEEVAALLAEEESSQLP